MIFIPEKDGFVVLTRSSALSAASLDKAEAESPEHLSPPKKSDTLRSDTSGAATSHDEGDVSFWFFPAFLLSDKSWVGLSSLRC